MYTLGKQWEIKIKKIRIGTLYIPKLSYIDFHERSNNTGSFVRYLKFLQNPLLHMYFGWTVANENKND